ncbi:hypothetical protein E6P09_01710 [Haloferax mediterranei ATCC 33500]|uniref:Uncharacterized protein n=1 Tax=Haloferax mediterranei (strain ATCC 33500 / DSM 1411 / JCM 8866 / NBRC 14739 / NCIMB 2177 / R-4) TaxID=523841 RepID=I3R629_HALMT|nr:hypothetical protein [Haloferax mediterranei]AFK19689.2 hypothetical protein HFX_1997 [Haloferax mediterranei ATCC 33500]AHZ23078.1 hypothetical protein BM92_10720 [Haloferax mediterranei ATCC 33500]EMA00011.1 hypothetical protein C439_11763 [Haloferax mediterranei ATCC 33500]MDX5987568.1 hypothetical protein [Haloferax mediterranei ATCC 33500]QCQ74062.1 hypothetical protein E6P09_01710 [Haloferax mediterranei ATCC 33500]
MSLRAIVEDNAFKYFLLVGGLAAVIDLLTTYFETGGVDLLVSALHFVVVVIFAVPLIAYWNYMDRRAEAE